MTQEFLNAITKRGNDDLTYDGEELGFSDSGCDCCGSQLSGDRYRATKLTAGNDVRDYWVCVDCINYIANGETPETWIRS